MVKTIKDGRRALEINLYIVLKSALKMQEMLFQNLPLVQIPVLLVSLVSRLPP